MNPEQLQFKLREILGNQIIFNKDFDQYAQEIKNIDENLIDWCIQIKEKKIKPITGSVLDDKIVFIKKNWFLQSLHHY